MQSRPDERRVLGFQPRLARAACGRGCRPASRRSLQAHLAGLGEDELTLGLDRLAEKDVVGVGDESRKRRAPLLERMKAQILALESEKVERDI
jgi:hypothetical protein